MRLKSDAGSAANRAGQIAICPARGNSDFTVHGSQTPDDGAELSSVVGDHQGYLETTLLLNSDAFDALLVMR